jgi:hypothetical protein
VHRIRLNRQESLYQTPAEHEKIMRILEKRLYRKPHNVVNNGSVQLINTAGGTSDARVAAQPSRPSDCIETRLAAHIYIKHAYAEMYPTQSSEIEMHKQSMEFP